MCQENYFSVDVLCWETEREDKGLVAAEVVGYETDSREDRGSIIRDL